MQNRNFKFRVHKSVNNLFSRILGQGLNLNLQEIKQLPLVTFIAIFWIVSGKIFTQFSFGSFSLGAIMTGGTFVLLFILLTITLFRQKSDLFHTSYLRDFRSQLPWVVLAFWLVGNLLFTSFFGKSNLTGVQNVASFLILLITELIVAISFSKDSILLSWKALRLITAVVAFYILFSQLFFGGIDRTIAISSLVLLSILIPGVPENIFIRIAPYALTLGILLSLSRTAFFLAMIILGFSAFRTENKPSNWKLFLNIGMYFTIFMLIVLFYGPMRERFIGGDAAINIGGVAITTEGRANLWSALTTGNGIDSGVNLDQKTKTERPITSDESLTSSESATNAIEEPSQRGLSQIAGHGAGAATSKIESDYPGISLPHNEYLRYLYDYGYIGLFLFLSGLLLFVFKTFREFVKTREPIHLGAFLSLLAMTTSAITDNPFVYIYAYLPMSFLIGLSLALSRVKQNMPLHD